MIEEKSLQKLERLQIQYVILDTFRYDNRRIQRVCKICGEELAVMLINHFNILITFSFSSLDDAYPLEPPLAMFISSSVLQP